jgi:hypothetical protein
MAEAYESTDIYLTFGKQAGLVPPWATIQTHGLQRDQFKVCVLSISELLTLPMSLGWRSPNDRRQRWLQYFYHCCLDSKKTESGCVELLGNQSLTISAKPVGVGAASQQWIPAGEECGLRTHIAITESVSLCGQMKS